jgi:hypothetical protein
LSIKIFKPSEFGEGKIKEGLLQEERLSKLNEVAIYQMELLSKGSGFSQATASKVE